MSPVFILAGNREQTLWVARQHDMARSEWRAATGPHALLGHRWQVLWLFGSWRDVPNHADILEMAKQRDFRIFEIKEAW